MIATTAPQANTSENHSVAIDDVKIDIKTTPIAATMLRVKIGCFWLSGLFHQRFPCFTPED
jgi:hypothetical protein